MSQMNKGSWPKPSQELIQLLADHMVHFEVEKKMMFGVPCYFVHGNMFAGVFSDKLFARFSETDRERIEIEALGTNFEPVQGRQMKEYRTLSRKVFDNPESFDEWLGRSYSYSSSLRPKENKKRSE